MWKFRDLADRLVSDGLVQSHRDFWTPEDPPAMVLSPPRGAGWQEDSQTGRMRPNPSGFTARLLAGSRPSAVVACRGCASLARSQQHFHCLLALWTSGGRGPRGPPDDWLLLAHDAEYCRGFLEGTLDAARWRRIGFTQCSDYGALVRRTRLEVAGTVLAARLALQRGLACHTAGGTHHAHRSWGSGYTILNDLAVAALLLLREGLVSRPLVCDLDVHQGDGTAEILAGEPRAFTFSVHCKDNFPFGFKGMSHLGADRSDLDVGLAAGTADQGYFGALEAHLPCALDLHRPDLVLYDAGVDVHADDGLGRLGVSWGGLRRREDVVLEACLSRKIPIVCVIGGGYDRSASRLSRRHSAVFHAAAAAWARHGL
ncbi:unnamed protein product [Prorocentrum cordatum]|uniref:Histone deacetylase domain-containing protein n=1 Tax=Prorocentrum cordatum TaxID=2364126 RepID=A0ABN9QM55_9DINO|nr:unnamed protein product [Polarella glacialis]